MKKFGLTLLSKVIKLDRNPQEPINAIINSLKTATVITDSKDNAFSEKEAIEIVERIKSALNAAFIQK